MSGDSDKRPGGRGRGILLSLTAQAGNNNEPKPPTSQRGRLLAAAFSQSASSSAVPEVREVPAPCTASISEKFAVGSSSTSSEGIAVVSSATSSEGVAVASATTSLDSSLGGIGKPQGRGRAMALFLSSVRGPGPSASDSNTAVPTISVPIVRALTSTHEPIPSTSASRPIHEPVCRETVEGVTNRFTGLGTESTEYKPPVIRTGEEGNRVRATANYIRLELDPNKGIFKYEVRFEPDLDDGRARVRILKEHNDVLGRQKTYHFPDLYLPHRLPDDVTVLHSKLADGTPVKVEVKFKGKQPARDCIKEYQAIFKRIHNVLGLTRIGQHSFDLLTRVQIPSHRLEVFPGYITAVTEYEDGIMLCIDFSHRVLRDETCLDLMNSLFISQSRSSRGHIDPGVIDDINNYFSGKSVITRYNYRTYKVSSVDFTRNPNSTFLYGDREVTFKEYFLQHQEIKLQYDSQPMLIHQREVRLPNSQAAVQEVCLPAEVCYLTGLTDDMRSNYKIMKDLNSHTAISPAERQEKLRAYVQRIRECPEAIELLNMWGLRIAQQTVDLTARILQNEKIILGNGTFDAQNGDWGRGVSRYFCLTGMDVITWVLVYVRKDERSVRSFLDTMYKCGQDIGVQIKKPDMIALNSDHTDTYIKTLKERCRHGDNPQIFVIIFPVSRDDRYSAVKKVLCMDIKKPSQMINARTISNPQKLRQITHKIALQMNCKLGGSLWTVKIPLKGVMFCGMDSYHEAEHKHKSVVGFVCSTNPDASSWYSRVYFSVKGQEIVDGMRRIFINCIQKYYNTNGSYPSRIIMYRDGVGDGELPVVKEHEIPQLLTCFSCLDPGYNPKFTYVVVQKRINTRIYIKARSYENPCPGTVIDNIITKRDWYDFFLISQNVRQGTVAPTHYVVVHDDSDMKVDWLQRITYKMCHMYYNWSGTVRVPAPCQYAHKLAYLVGQNIHAEPGEELCDKLYFL